MPGVSKHPPAARRRAVARVRERRDDAGSQWAAIRATAQELGVSAETLRTWVRRVEVDEGVRPGTTGADRRRIRDLEREVARLRRDNEVLAAATAFLRRELDPRQQPS